jgi:hypothetical protein
MPLLGFALLTHRQPAQIERLLARLRWMFPDAPIVCHHDFHQCPLDTDRFPGVEFVRPSLRTKWGTFTPVEAMLRALHQLAARDDAPEWVTVLSGTSYPIKPAEVIAAELGASRSDAHLFSIRIDPRNLRDERDRFSYRRWHGLRLGFIPYLGKGLRLRWIPLDIRSPRLPWLDGPFSADFPCYMGEAWFSARLPVVRKILDHHHTRPALARHLRNRRNTLEVYVHSIVRNTAGLKVSDNCKQYVDWSEWKDHPRTLTTSDLPALLASDAHFARKFDPGVDTEILDRLDEVIGWESRSGAAAAGRTPVDEPGQ